MTLVPSHQWLGDPERVHQWKLNRVINLDQRRNQSMSWMGTLPQASTRLMDFKWNCSPDVMPKNLLCNLFAFLYMTCSINAHCHGCLLLTSQKKKKKLTENSSNKRVQIIWLTKHLISLQFLCTATHKLLLTSVEVCIDFKINRLGLMDTYFT